MKAIPRGAIKRFREHLNALPQYAKHHNKVGKVVYQQRTRKYGDYLYAQDREKFMVDLAEWLATKGQP